VGGLGADGGLGLLVGLVIVGGNIDDHLAGLLGCEDVLDAIKELKKAIKIN
jgi:hypothetical protein